MKDNIKIFTAGIISRNPIFFLVLGMCPTLAVTTSVENGIGMGIATAFVLIFSSLFISIIRKYISEDIRIPSFIVIIAGFVTIISLLMEAYVPSINLKLGIYVPLIVVNCIVLGRVLAFAYKNPPIPSLFDALGTGIGFTVALIIIAGIREIIGTASLSFLGEKVITFPFEPISFMIYPPGALLTMGFLLAAFTFVRNK